MGALNRSPGGFGSNGQKIDVINIVLIFVSLFLAYQLPFGLFLFSYAVLGPLHYFTEINWLKEKNYFINKRRWVWVFTVLAFLAAAALLLKLKFFHAINTTGFISYQLNSNNLLNLILLIAVIFAAVLIYIKKDKQILLFLAISLVTSFLLFRYAPFQVRLLCIFLPTLIHVYLFTLLFMIAGSLKSKSWPGIIAVILLMICPVVIFTFNINAAHYRVDMLTKATFTGSGLYNINSDVAKITGSFTRNYSPFLSAAGIRIQVFIAFCYTYHYLNWFSKTSVIGWSKNIPVSKVILILLAWAGSVWLYWYNYSAGFTVLFFLSTLHVLLEFPLNISSVNQVYNSMRFKTKLQGGNKIAGT